MENNQNPVYQEIQDDENFDQSNHIKQEHQPKEDNHIKQNQYQHEQEYHHEEIRQLSSQNNVLSYEEKANQNEIKYDEQTKQESQGYFEKQKESYNTVDQQDLGKYANYEEQNQDGEGIKLSISKTEKRGGLVSKHVVYIIEGYDKKGTFCVPRRFNEFYEMRSAMVNRWPGCFIPSIPAKNMMKKNDDEVIVKRVRYLNQFVKKMAKLPHLFYGEEFQTLLRAQQQDISELFSKWPTLSSQAIINKYRVNFSDLAGKQLNYETNQKIKGFLQFIRKNQTQLQKDRQAMKKLAQANDKVNSTYGQFFTNIAPNYERNCLTQYCEKNQKETLYLNQSQIKLQEHQALIKQTLKVNPYWMLYDVIRQQQRDGLAFIQALQAKMKYQTKKNQIEIKITSNQKNVLELSTGKKPMFGGGKGTPEQMKYKIEVQIQQLRRQKQNVLIIIDIVTALIVFIEIQRYKQQKRKYYLKTLGRISGNQIAQVQNLAQIWMGLKEASMNKINQYQSK